MKIPGLGALHYRFITKPRDAFDVWLGRRHLSKFRDSIQSLSPFPATPPNEANAIRASYLTGTRFLYQTVFSAYSLLRHCPENIRIRIVSDGSLQDSDYALLDRLFPGRVDRESEAAQTARFEQAFPAQQFPHLRKWRGLGALFRKLTDVHGGSSDWNLLIDSDTYFHAHPTLLMQCARDQRRPCMARDRWTNYGYSVDELQKLAGYPVLPEMNSGLVGLAGSSIDWSKIEFWLGRMAEGNGNNHFFEQGMTAMMVSSLDPVRLPLADYRLCPDRAEILNPTAAFHHYAGNSKFQFIRYNVPTELFEH